MIKSNREFKLHIFGIFKSNKIDHKPMSSPSKEVATQEVEKVEGDKKPRPPKTKSQIAVACCIRGCTATGSKRVFPYPHVGSVNHICDQHHTSCVGYTGHPCKSKPASIFRNQPLCLRCLVTFVGTRDRQFAAMVQNGEQVFNLDNVPAQPVATGTRGGGGSKPATEGAPAAPKKPAPKKSKSPPKEEESAPSGKAQA